MTDSDDNFEWPTSQTIDEFELRLTCESCPEQYDVYRDGRQVAYFRLRHGQFRVDVPGCGGETIYVNWPKGDGMFDDDERDHYLGVAVDAVRRYWQGKQ